jgi:hypothetical protein
MESYCKTINSCDEYTKNYLDYCDENSRCAVYGGICAPHPCFSVNVNEGETCPFGCMTEDFKLLEDEELEAGLLKMEKYTNMMRQKSSKLRGNINSKDNKDSWIIFLENGKVEHFDFVMEYNPYSSFYENYINYINLPYLHKFLPKREEISMSFLSPPSSGYSFEKMKSGKNDESTSKRCVVETCARYSNLSCINHGLNKCVPKAEGCRCGIDSFFYIILIVHIDWENAKIMNQITFLIA